jgi:hypothetical protein
MSTNHHRDHVWSSTYSLVLAKTQDPEQAADAADRAVARLLRGTAATSDAAPAGNDEPQA